MVTFIIVISGIMVKYTGWVQIREDTFDLNARVIFIVEDYNDCDYIQTIKAICSDRFLHLN